MRIINEKEVSVAGDFLLAPLSRPLEPFRNVGLAGMKEIYSILANEVAAVRRRARLDMVFLFVVAPPFGRLVVALRTSP
jgi:hypothetical protein